MPSQQGETARTSRTDSPSNQGAALRRKTSSGSFAGSFAKCPEKARAQRPRQALRPPLHPWCQARRWRRRARRARGRRHCTGPVGLCRVHVPRRLVQFARPRPASRADLSPRLLRLLAQSAIMANGGSNGLRASLPPACRFPSRPSEHGSLRHVVIIADCALRHGADEGRNDASGARGNEPRTKVRAALPRAPVTVILPALRAAMMAPPPPWSPVCGRSSSRRAFRLGLDTTMPGARRPAFIRFAHSLGLPPAAQSGAVAPRCRAPPLRGWRVALARRWRAATPPTRASRRAAETRRSAKTVWA